MNTKIQIPTLTKEEQATLTSEQKIKRVEAYLSTLPHDVLVEAFIEVTNALCIECPFHPPTPEGWLQNVLRPSDAEISGMTDKFISESMDIRPMLSMLTYGKESNS